jgi:hypothetical protein
MESVDRAQDLADRARARSVEVALDAMVRRLDGLYQELRLLGAAGRSGQG